MKKAFIINKLLFLCLAILALLHILILSKVLSPEILWDGTLKDYRSIIFSELLTLIFMVPALYLYRLCYTRIKIKSARLMIIKILRIALIYFILQFIGSLLGDSFIYKMFSSIIYLGLTLLTINAIYFTSVARKSKTRHPSKL